jgi:CubicO group peptidase (beta-lactamase class C family)
MSWHEYLEVTHTDAVIVLHRGVIIEERYRRDMTAATPHMVFSITKSIIGLLAEILAAEGSIDLAVRVSHHVPELAASAFADASIRDLLDMVDGAAFDETYANPEAEIHTWSPAYWGPKTGQPPSLGVYEALIGLTRRAARPGSRFAYRTPVGDVIGWVLQRATGQALSDLIATRLWGPMGAEHDAYLIVDPAGQEIAATGFNATARDMARLALMLLEDDPVNGSGRLPAGALASLRRGGDRALFAAADQPTRPGWSYRSLWWHTHNANGAYCALGVYGQRLFIDPVNHVAIVRFGSHPEAGSAPTDAVHAAAFDALVEALT